MDRIWQKIIESQKTKEYFINLEKFLVLEYKNKVVCPPYNQIFNALELTDFKDVKVVIIGQDPYYGLNQANGLAFSVNKKVRIPQSLKNIYKELAQDCKIQTPQHGDLTSWSKQGVLLLNTVLTVELNKPLSHQNRGWEVFTKEIVSELAKDNKPKVFVLWGGNAQSLETIITNKKHLILKAPHPSPLSAYRGFFGSKPFSKINSFLELNNIQPIYWSVV